ncbi:DUF6350 family protein [Corynebacterium choanae]|uniref:Uncharacterized protein n=1 Tax=Corynebacterium choanae TaxID=1862358 RepID=A0A3G6J548_9CORY|nr:DUF6350 family protein [Corynebacterium choanae]AZA13069.1 hypothetical protein CCHOA_03285 [Corynebacterium choanae]
MSRKTSPQARASHSTRPARIGRSARRSATKRGQAPAGGGKAKVEAAATLPSRLWRLAPALLAPSVILATLVVMVSFGLLQVMHQGFVPLPATIGQLWLAAHLVPVSSDRATLGVLPMLPAVILMWFIARQVRLVTKDRIGMGELVMLAVGTPAVPAVLTAIATFMVWDASPVFPVVPPAVVPAVGQTILVYLVGLVCGISPRLARALCRRLGIAQAVPQAATVAAEFLRYLLIAATVVLGITMVWHLPQIVELSGSFHSRWAIAGIALLSLLYVPNAIIATASVLLGSGLEFGDATISLFAVTLVPLPPLPLLAGLPATAPWWFQFLLVLPAVAAGFAIARYLRRGGGSVVVLLVASALAAIGLGVLIGFAGGEAGVYGYAGAMQGLSMGLAALWMAAVSIAAWLVYKVAAWWRNRRSGDSDESTDTPGVEREDSEPGTSAAASHDPAADETTPTDGAVSAAVADTATTDSAAVADTPPTDTEASTDSPAASAAASDAAEKLETQAETEKRLASDAAATPARPADGANTASEAAASTVNTPVEPAMHAKQTEDEQALNKGDTAVAMEAVSDLDTAPTPSSDLVPEPRTDTAAPLPPVVEQVVASDPAILEDAAENTTAAGQVTPPQSSPTDSVDSSQAASSKEDHQQ